MNEHKSIIIIQGPTAIGKTSVSIELAKYYNTEIISADSRQFYKELQIGTSPPNPTQLQAIKHHFIQHLSIKEDYNAGKFEKDAIKRIENLLLIHDKLIVVGGSGLYLDAICKGIDPMPETKELTRRKIQTLYNKNGIKYLQKEIKNKDPEYFQKVDQNNPQRLMRALEIIYSNGKGPSSYRKNKNTKRKFQILKIGLEMNREDLYNRINTRVDEMMNNGFLKEVKSLKSNKTQNALQTIGYKELFEHLEGNTTLDESIEKIKQNTRRFAKRQITWFKKDKSVNYFSPNNINKIKRFIGL